MIYRIKNETKLTRILWWDFALGFSAGVAGLFLIEPIAKLCGLPEMLVLVISAVTFGYSCFSFYLAIKKNRSALYVKYLVVANWSWAVISLGFLGFHFMDATILGLFFIVGQIAIVGGLAFLEGKQLGMLEE